MKTELVFLAVLVLLNGVLGADIDHREVKCQVCKATIVEMEAAIAKVDPAKKVQVGGFRLDDTGSATSKKISLAKSEMYLTELMENICDKMDDYARARYKNNGRLTVLKLITDAGGMNPETSKVDFVQDEDLNKSLKHYCLEILEDFEEPVLKLYMSEEPPKDPEYELCTNTAKFCDDMPVEEDYEFEERDEL